MFFYLSKILNFLMMPWVWVFLLMVSALVFRKKRKLLLIGSLSVFYFFGNRFIADEVYRLYEPEKKNIYAVKNQYEAGVVLGNGLTFDPETGLINFNESSDRLFAAIQLYKLGKIKKILFTGGSGFITRQDEKEARLVKQYLLDIGIPEKDILIEDQSKNTYENAKFTAELLNAKKINTPVLLITSASHMKRAQLCFQKQQIPVETFPVDFQHGKRIFYFDHLFIPDPKALKLWYQIIHEWFGLVVYKIMGYL